jgi:hypothetical protein
MVNSIWNIRELRHFALISDNYCRIWSLLQALRKLLHAFQNVLSNHLAALSKQELSVQ